MTRTTRYWPTCGGRLPLYLYRSWLIGRCWTSTMPNPYSAVRPMVSRTFLLVASDPRRSSGTPRSPCHWSPSSRCTLDWLMSNGGRGSRRGIRFGHTSPGLRTASREPIVRSRPATAVSPPYYEHGSKRSASRRSAISRRLIVCAALGAPHRSVATCNSCFASLLRTWLKTLRVSAFRDQSKTDSLCRTRCPGAFVCRTRRLRDDATTPVDSAAFSVAAAAVRTRAIWATHGRPPRQTSEPANTAQHAPRLVVPRSVKD